MKNTRLLLTLWLMLLTAFMPPMAFACATVCAIGCEQMMEPSPSDAMDAMMAMPDCDHEGMAVTAPIDKPHSSSIDKTTPCLANIMCHLTVGMNTTPLLIKSSPIYSVIVPHRQDFMPQVVLSPPDKPPRV